MEEYRALLDEACGQLPKGAFLMVEGNPMTIGWAQFGVVWGRPVCTVFVRHSRHTHALLEKSGLFTVSVPAAGTMREALAYCGSHSGRDGDKLAACGLSLLEPRAGGAAPLGGCAMHFECRVVLRAEIDLDCLEPGLRARFYGDNQATADGDPHTVYFGEILAAYRES